MRKAFLTYLIVACGFVAFAQDSSSVLSFEQFVGMVANHHPIALSANYEIQIGTGKLLKARGAFDPKIGGDLNQKRYTDKDYYTKIDAGFKIPTWFGISLDGGYENNRGDYLSAESNTPSDGLWSLGGSINIGKGLFIDERRANLKQARLMRDNSILDQKLMVNDLMYHASMAYWNWFKAYNAKKVFEDAVIVAQERFDAVKSSARLGDKPMVDTLKSFIVLQERKLGLEQSNLEFKNKQMELEVYLWKDGLIPLELNGLSPVDYQEIVFPEPTDGLSAQIETWASTHPEILTIQNQLEMAKVDLRLSRENLKPTIQLKYNTLSPGIDNIDLNTYDIDNYKWGAKVSIPLFLRKERGELKISNYKYKQMEAKTALKIESTKFKIEKSMNNWYSYSRQVAIQSINLNSYQNLYRAENTLFDAGESSMFLVNTRDNDRINAQIKYIKTLTEGLIEKALFDYHTFRY